MDKYIDRREFIKLVASVTGGLLIGACSPIQTETMPLPPTQPPSEQFKLRMRETLQNQRSIDMSEFVIAENGLPNPKKKIDYEKLSVVFPELMGIGEHGKYFVSGEPDAITLDFGKLPRETILLEANRVEVARSNVASTDPNVNVPVGTMEAGLVLFGNWKIKGSISNNPVFDCNQLDRGIAVFGNGENQNYIEDVSMTNLKDFVTENEPTLTKWPAYISAQNSHLEMAGVNIAHTAMFTPTGNDADKQFTKAVSVHNTINAQPVKVKIATSVMEGHPWDGIYTHGCTQLLVDNCRITQDEVFSRYVGGSMTPSIFNDYRGEIYIKNSTLTAFKGVDFFALQDINPSGTRPKLWIENSTISNYSPTWGVYIDKANIDGRLSNVTFIPFRMNLGEAPEPYEAKEAWANEQPYYPVASLGNTGEINLQFDKITLAVTDEPTNITRVMVIRTTNLGNMFPVEFLNNWAKGIGDIQIKLPNSDENIILTRTALTSAMDWIGKNDAANYITGPIDFNIHFDKNRRLFGIKLQYFQEKSFWCDQTGQIVEVS